MDHAQPESRDVPPARTAEDVRRLARMFRFGDPIVLIEERIILATPEAWATLPECSDATWRSTTVELGATSVVIATRLES